MIKTKDITTGQVFEEYNNKKGQYVLYIGSLDTVETINDEIVVDRRYIYITRMNENEAKDLILLDGDISDLVIDYTHKKKIRAEKIIGKVNNEVLKLLYKKTELVIDKPIIWWK